MILLEPAWPQIENCYSGKLAVRKGQSAARPAQEGTGPTGIVGMSNSERGRTRCDHFSLISTEFTFPAASSSVIVFAGSSNQLPSTMNL